MIAAAVQWAERITRKIDNMLGSGNGVSVVSHYIDLRDPPPNRRSSCDGAQEQHLTEAAVIIAFGMYLLEQGALTVELHPDGEHGKRHDLKKSLEVYGLMLVRPQGITSYGGTYQRGHQTVHVTLKPGVGDVVTEIGGKAVVAECKGGVVNTRHAGQLSKLRRGLCEAVGLLMARPLKPNVMLLWCRPHLRPRK